ncbi:hypothetical protein COY33_01175, partial [candidate division WWE3 bacterium CG_4_10_14_0_2_um_filter_42_7]
TTQREGGEPGDQIRFCIGNCYADQTATWQYGGSAELNLSYSGACNPCWAAPPEEPPVCPGPKQMDGDAPQSLSDVWQYAPFTPTYTGEVYFVSIKAGNYGGGARSVTCKVTNAARTADISITASSATFTNLDGAQWREVDFNSNRFSLTAGIQYNVACRGPDSWNSLYWIYLNEPVNGKTYVVCQDTSRFTLSGHVWEDGEVKDCAQGGLEANLSGWGVTLTGSDTYSSLTNASGDYSIPLVKPGTYTSCLVPPAGPGTWRVGCFKENGVLGVIPVYPSLCKSVTVSADKTIDWGAWPNGVNITGRVWEDSVLKNCVINAEEPKLSGRTVSVQETGQSAVTNGTGNYTITNVSLGLKNICVNLPTPQYSVTCIREDTVLKTPPTPPSTCYQVNLAANKALNFGLRVTKTNLLGRVCNDTVSGSSCSLAPLGGDCASVGSSPASGVTVCAGGECDETDGAGLFEIPNLDIDGSYTVGISGYGSFTNFDTSCGYPNLDPASNLITLDPFIVGSIANFGITERATSPWFQIKNGDAHANGIFRSLVDEDNYLIIGSGANPTLDSYGVVSATGEINLGDGGVSPNEFREWQVPDYETISWDEATTFTTQKFDELWAMPETTPLSWGNLEVGGIYHLSDGATEVDVNTPGYKLGPGGAADPGAPGVAILLSRGGNVLVKKLAKNQKASPNSTIILIVKDGQIRFQAPAENIDGVFIAVNRTIVTYSNGSMTDKQLKINGMLYAKVNVDLNRDRDVTDENLTPSEIFTYQPFLLDVSLFPISLAKTGVSWREIE